MKNEEILEKVIQRLDGITRILVQAAFGNRSITEQIRILSRCGFGPKEIADMVGTTNNTVNVTLSKLRKPKKPPLPRARPTEGFLQLGQV